MKNDIRIKTLNRVLLILILLTVSFNIVFLMRYNFQADSAFFVTLAQEQLRTHSLFPEGMHYSTGLFILTPNLFVIPFLLITDNLVLARQLAILLLWLFVYIVLYAVFITKKERNIKGYILASSVFSILYVNSSVVSMHFYQGAYISYLLFLLSFLALMNRIISYKSYNKKYYAGVLALYVLANLGDIRNLIIWGIPGLLAYILFIFLESEKKVELILQKCEEITFARVLLNSVLFSFTFYVIMAIIYGNSGSTSSMIELEAKDYGESVYHILIGLFNLFGNSYTARVFSGDGLFKLVNFIMAFFLIFIIPVVAVKNYKNMNSQYSRFLVLFSLVSSTFYLFAVFITGAAIYLDRYLLPVYNNIIIVFAVTGSYFLDKIKSYKIAKFGITCVLLYVIASNLFYIYSQKESLVYHKFGYFAAGEEGLTDFLENKGLQYGYATFTNAEEYSVLSDNRVRIRSVVFDQGTVSPVKWLTSDTFYEPDIYVGNTFLMITDDELKKGFPNGINVWGQPKETFIFKKYNIFVYDYNVSKKFSKAKNGLWLIRGAKSAVYVVDE